MYSPDKFPACSNRTGQLRSACCAYLPRTHSFYNSKSVPLDQHLPIFPPPSPRWPPSYALVLVSFIFFHIPYNGRTYQSFPVCLNYLTMIFSTFIQVVPSEIHLHNCLQESCYWMNKSLSQAIKIIKCKERKPKVKPSQRTCLKFLKRHHVVRVSPVLVPFLLFISTLTRNREGGDLQLRESSHCHSPHLNRLYTWMIFLNTNYYKIHMPHRQKFCNSHSYLYNLMK